MIKNDERYENDPTLALWFTPLAIRDHFDVDDDELADWVRKASPEELAEIGQAALGSDILYSAFHDILRLLVEDEVNREANKGE